MPGPMNKNATLCLAFVGTLIFAAGGGGCSDDSSTGSTSAGFECPAVGSKSCPNDDATTQLAADTCKRCETQYKTWANCAGLSKPACSAEGKSLAADTSKCKTELDAIYKCVAGGTDGGT